MRCASLLGAAVVLLAPGGSARAQETLALEWDAPEACPTAEVIRAGVGRLLGGSIPEQEEAVHARAVTASADDGFRLTLSTDVGEVHGERVLEGESCAELGEAAALILALMIDPDAVAVSAEPEPERDPELERDPEPALLPGEGAQVAQDLGAPSAVEVAVEAVELVPVEPEVGRAEANASTAEVDEPLAGPAEDESLRGFIGVAGLLDVGSVPEVSGGVALEGGLGVPLVDARVRATYVFPRSARRADDATSGAQITNVSVDARACVHPFESARFIYGCAGLMLGVAIAEGFGFDRDETGVGTFGAALVGLGVAWRPAPWFDLDVDAALIVPFNPLEFGARGVDEAFHTQSPVAGRFGLTAHVRF